MDGTGSAEALHTLTTPYYMALGSSTTLYVADAGTGQVLVMSRDGTGSPSEVAALALASAVALSPTGSIVHYAAATAGQISSRPADLSVAGSVLATLPANIQEIDVDAEGRIYATCSDGLVYRIEANGSGQVQVGNAGTTGARGLEIGV